MRLAGVRLRPLSFAYVLFEDAVILFALVAALAFAHHDPAAPLHLARAAAAVFAVKAVFFYAGLYDFRHLASRAVFWTRLLAAIAVASGLAWVAFAAPRGEGVAFACFVALFAPGVVLCRAAYEALCRAPRFRRRLLFLGAGEHARRAAREILELRNRHYEVVGFLGEDASALGWRIGQKPVLGTYADLLRIAERERVRTVVVAVPDRRRGLPLDALLALRLRGVEILEEPRVHEEFAGKIPVEDLRPSWLIFSDGFRNTPWRAFTKRTFDVVFALLGLVLVSPLLPLLALAIRLESKGLALYRQRRVGQGGREFTLLKFRSMRADAEAEGSPQWARERDPRVTRVGRFLRKTRLDELPQLWNVLEGSMSFVGPRPERPFFVERLRAKIPFYDQRHAVKPGLTGWAQVRFRYGSDEADAVEKLRYDMFYVKHHSILFDLRILLETAKVIFEGSKAR